METLFVCKRTWFALFWPIVHMDPVNQVLKPGLKMEKSENAALASSCGQQICHRPSPRPLAFDLLTLRRLITATTTTTMEDYMLVLVLQKILSLSELLEQNILLLCHYAEQKRIMDNPLAIFVCFFLCSVSSSTVCLYTSFMRMLRLFFSIFGEFQVPPIWDMNYSVLSRLQWIHSDANILETMPKKTGEQFG